MSLELREYADHDAVGLAQLINSRQVSSSEVQDAARRAVEEVNPELNALAAPLFDTVEDHDQSGPFGGVPFAIKDLRIRARGIPSQAGTRLAGEGAVPATDSFLMARFRASGLAAIGRTATPEFGMSASTESVLNGATRNPYDTTRSSGGSSGGSAALVAARALPLAHGSDGGGSIRAPSALCGLVGLKPGKGRISDGPGASSPGLSVQFGLTRTVRDCAALLDAASGQGIDDWFTLNRPERSFAEEALKETGPLRVALCTEPWHEVAVDPEHVDAAKRVAHFLESGGHDVSEARPPFYPESVDQAVVASWAAGVFAGASRLAASRGIEPGPNTLEAVTLAFYELGSKQTALDLLRADGTFAAASSALAHWFADYDVLVTPTLGHVASPLGTLDLDAPGVTPLQWLTSLYEVVSPFVTVFNVTGVPALSLPVAESTDGLPIGVQLVTRYQEEITLLRLGMQIEEAMSWSDRVPRVCVGSSR